MGRNPRMHEPDVVYEGTTRTIGGRHLLRPSAVVNALILGIVGYALARFQGIRIYGVVFLSNHATWLLGSSDPDQIARFMKFVNEHISKKVGAEDVHDWTGTMWGRRYDAIPVIGEAALIDRMKHLLAQGCKEGLVWTPLDWPGASSARAMLGGDTLRGTWYDRSSYRDAKAKAGRKGKDVKLEDFAVTYEVPLSPLPCWAHLSPAAYRAAIQGLVDEITAETRKTYKRVVGKRRILAVDPHSAPENFEPTPRPLCHASDKPTRTAYRERLGGFVAAFRYASELVRQGIAAVFPPYSYPPGAPMVVPLA